MKSLLKILKSIAFSILPESALFYLKKSHYARVLQGITESEEEGLRLLKHLVQPGSVVVDAGANIGVYTKFLSRLVGADGLVCSIEPMNTTFEFLSNNISSLGLTNVELFRCAVSDYVGSAQMEVPDYASKGKNFYQARITRSENNGSSGFEVPVEKLDSLLKDYLEKISFIKIDVEGEELRCIGGGEKLFSEIGPACFIEVGSNPDDSSSDGFQLFEKFANWGYQVFRFDGSKLYPRKTGDKEVNYVFLKSNHVEKLTQQGLI